jgi:hypothetical protein
MKKREGLMLLQLHIVAASAWLGLVAAETVIELSAKERVTRRFVADAHKVMDLYFEGPLVAITLVTGSMLLMRLWPHASALLLIKIVAGLVAVVSNIVCIRWVVRRANTDVDSDFVKLGRKITITGYTIPFGAAALAIGLYGV